MDAVVLGPARRHDHDRRPDSLGPHGLDQLPAVEAGQHQIEHAGVRLLEAEACEALLAVRHPRGVEAGGVQVPRHALRDDLVVLDDQHLRHRCHYRAWAAAIGAPTGERVVKGW
jgi:hypothetical protein